MLYVTVLACLDPLLFPGRLSISDLADVSGPVC